MKAAGYILLIGLWLLSSCKPTDPQANLLIGTWQQTAIKLNDAPDWNDVSQGSTVTFRSNGSITSTSNYLLSGGWCNVAERYMLNDSRIFFQFGEPQCIPFVPPSIPSEATIKSLTPQLLILEWGNNLLKFERS